MQGFGVTVVTSQMLEELHMHAWGTCAVTSQHIEYPAAAAAAAGDMQAPRQHAAARPLEQSASHFLQANSVACFLVFLKISCHQLNYATT